MALGEGVGHQGRDGRYIDLQRVDAHVGLTGGFRQPGRQGFQVEFFARSLQVIKLLRREKLERMQLDIHRTATLAECRFRVVLAQIAFGDQFTQHVVQVEPAIL
ncbi:sugar ABC transporter substrate-binding protein [Pseudomonas syringae pv. spinaceae]|uniref:Sugar ABC transporter substrate-binding protein n=1 Tax=Pseudomonas syringae pv. spinaceae TaxID=264459 RepID=A0A0Q0AJT7_PSESX|nr:sugar ABC transporter substrate-binding protein [Pseudomonas syringae pv. spinaceae]